MRLLHFNGKICKHMIDIVPGIKATYQMEQEFYPYLDIDFLTNAQHDEQNSGIILQTKNGIIKRYYDFKDKKELEQLRALIWEYLLKEKNIVEVEETQQNNDRNLNPNRVIQGWSNVVKEHKQHIYPNVKSPYLNLPVDSNFRSLNNVFRLNPNDVQTKDTCKLQRYQECTDNYPAESAEFKRCVAEVNWVCENGYPNKRLELHNKYAQTVWEGIYKDLKENNGLVNKQNFDDIIDAGLFYDTGMRPGNNPPNHKRYENFDTDTNYNWNIFMFLIIMVTIIMLYYYTKN